jgi:hypothetical protein
MTFIEKGVLLQALRAAVIYAIYLSWMQGYHADGSLYAAGAGVVVGKAALWLVGLTVGAGLVVQIGVTIVSGITRDENLAHLSDERDKQIERRAIEAGFGIVGVGFVTLMAALAAGWPVGIALNLLVLGFVLADLVVNFLKFRAYLKGF